MSTETERLLDGLLDEAQGGFESFGQAHPDDEGFLDRAATEAADAVVVGSGPTTPGRAAATRIGLGVTAVVGGAIVAWLLWGGADPTPVAGPAMAPPVAAPTSPSGPASTPPPRAELAPEPKAVGGGLAVDPEPGPQTLPSTRSDAADAPGDDGMDAEALLAAANAARRADEHRKARRLYDELLRRFPGSRQARTARVSRGRLSLDVLGRPEAALRDFQAYLQAEPDGTLAEEARVGVAMAQRKLGRDEDEARAWEALLRHHPRSLHATRARTRLQVLTGPQAP